MRNNIQKGSLLGLARVGLAILGLVGLVACTGPKYPPAPKDTNAADYHYVIGAGDTLNIIVWRNPDLSQTLQVRPDGRISSPLVDDLPAQGRNPADLARDIEKALSKFIRDPVVTVMVNTFQGPFSEQIRIVGEATKPAAVPYRQHMTVLDVMIQAGGLTDYADGNASVLIRGSENGKAYSLRLRDLLKRGDISANVDVQPGDVIIIPQSWF
ncbi:MAG: XrtA/PEP-CTERM system exopolysaccharide export protein [Burkholderiaceae bacterium]|jgi:polysaccharide export outer membrane protein